MTIRDIFVLQNLCQLILLIQKSCVVRPINNNYLCVWQWSTIINVLQPLPSLCYARIRMRYINFHQVQHNNLFSPISRDMLMKYVLLLIFIKQINVIYLCTCKDFVLYLANQCASNCLCRISTNIRDVFGGLSFNTNKQFDKTTRLIYILEY